MMLEAEGSKISLSQTDSTPRSRLDDTEGAISHARAPPTASLSLVLNTRRVAKVVLALRSLWMMLEAEDSKISS